MKKHTSVIIDRKSLEQIKNDSMIVPKGKLFLAQWPDHVTTAKYNGDCDLYVIDDWSEFVEAIAEVANKTAEIYHDTWQELKLHFDKKY